MKPPALPGVLSLSWGFERGDQYANQSAKPAVELEQEAAEVLAQGGAYQIYYVPTRAGWIDDRVVKTATQLASFCRKRQRWSHRSESLPEAGVFFSGRTLYRTSGRVFGSWGMAETPAAGALDLLLACGYSADLIPDWQAAKCRAQYPLMVVPDWQDIGDEAVEGLTHYAAEGGKLLLCGAENARLFSNPLGLRLTGAAQDRTMFLADDTGFAQVTGNWAEIDAPGEQIAAHAYLAPDTRQIALPLAVHIPCGRGTVVVCPGPIASTYGGDSTPILRSLLRGMLQLLHLPMVQLDADNPAVEIVLRKKDGQILIHLINTEGTPVTGEFRHSGVVPHTGPIGLRVRLGKAPARVVLEPEGELLSGEYKAGEWQGVLPNLHVHSMVRIEGGA